MMKIETTYEAQARLGPGFYNRVIIEGSRSHADMLYGPYASRPVARIEAARIVLNTREKSHA